MNLRCFGSRAFVSHKQFVTDEGKQFELETINMRRFGSRAFVSQKRFVTDEGSRAETSQVHCPCNDKVCSLMSTILLSVLAFTYL